MCCIYINKNSYQYKKFGNIIFPPLAKTQTWANRSDDREDSPFISISLGELVKAGSLSLSLVPQFRNMNRIGFCRNKRVFGGPVQIKAP